MCSTATTPPATLQCSAAPRQPLSRAPSAGGCPLPRFGYHRGGCHLRPWNASCSPPPLLTKLTLARRFKWKACVNFMNHYLLRCYTLNTNSSCSYFSDLLRVWHLRWRFCASLLAPIVVPISPSYCFFIYYLCCRSISYLMQSQWRGLCRILNWWSRSSSDSRSSSPRMSFRARPPEYSSCQSCFVRTCPRHPGSSEAYAMNLRNRPIRSCFHCVDSIHQVWK